MPRHQFLGKHLVKMVTLSGMKAIGDMQFYACLLIVCVTLYKSLTHIEKAGLLIVRNMQLENT